MSLKTRAAWLLAATLLLPVTAPAQAQRVDVKLQPTAKAESAKTAFRLAMYESQNLGASDARKHVAAAIASDPAFGLARVYQTVIAANMTPAAREAAIAPVLGAMGSASPAEVLLALYWRESAAGRAAAAVPILKATTELIPDDAEIAYMYTNALGAGKTPAEQVVMLRQLLERFPAHAAAHNQLAYTLWRAGDGQGALAAVKEYAKHAPNHANAHDSYADILLLLGRGEEAIPHVQRELEIDPDFPGAYAKLGSIELTRGNVRAARAHFVTAVSRATTPADRIEAMYWQAATHVYDRNARAAAQDIGRVAQLATSEDMPGALALAHDRAAVLDAYLGSRKEVSKHLAAAEAAAGNDIQKAAYQAHSAIALSRIGQADQARAAAARFAGIGTPDQNAVNSIDALIALDSKNYSAAGVAIAKLTGPELLTKALRAELAMRTGRKAEGQALRQEVLASSVKMDGNAPLDFIALIGRMRAAAL